MTEGEAATSGDQASASDASERAHRGGVLWPTQEPEGVNRRVMPGDFSISLRHGRGTDARRDGHGSRAHSMRGFEDTYVDIVDYIVRITHRIWEDQDVGYIYDTYAPACVVHDDHGTYHGVEPVVEATIQSIHTSPNKRSYADEVIWAGDDEQGFVTSHRYVNAGYLTGPTTPGVRPGRKIAMWGIANCLVVENEIVEEWVLYNLCSKLSQAGVDVVAAAKEVADSGVLERAAVHPPEVDRLIGGRRPELLPESRGPEAEFDVEFFLRALWHNLWNRRDLSAVYRGYAPNVAWWGASGRSGYGRADVQAFVRGLLATFPDLSMHVDEVYWMGNDDEGYRVSLRWTAVGTHRGAANYGTPTGRLVRLWGISQLYLHGGQITEEWSMFNEFDVLAQIHGTEPRPLFT